MAAFSYGRLDPHPEETHPRVKFADHMTATMPVNTPVVVDWASRVSVWPVYMNNTIGDCTCAALGHAVQAWTTYASGVTVTLPDQSILDLYEAVSGYNPKTGVNDNGAVEQDVLTYVQKNGIGGHKIRAFAQVDHTNPAEMKTALELFGTLYLGMRVPRSAEVEFQMGQPWQNIGDQQIMGGHAIDLQKVDADYMYVVTWGKLQPMTVDFWMTYGSEAWAIITDDWLNAQGQDPEGLNLQQLLSEFDFITHSGADQPKKGCNLIGGWWISRFVKPRAKRRHGKHER